MPILLRFLGLSLSPSPATDDICYRTKHALEWVSTQNDLTYAHAQVVSDSSSLDCIRGSFEQRKSSIGANVYGL
jgi:hypothetical protein